MEVLHQGAREAREEMLLHASDHSDKIAEAYMEGREIPEEKKARAIRIETGSAPRITKQ